MIFKAVFHLGEGSQIINTTISALPPSKLKEIYNGPLYLRNPPWGSLHAQNLLQFLAAIFCNGNSKVPIYLTFLKVQSVYSQGLGGCKQASKANWRKYFDLAMDSIRFTNSRTDNTSYSLLITGPVSCLHKVVSFQLFSRVLSSSHPLGREKKRCLIPRASWERVSCLDSFVLNHYEIFTLAASVFNTLLPATSCLREAPYGAQELNIL